MARKQSGSELSGKELAACKAFCYAFNRESDVTANALCFSPINMSPFHHAVIKVDISVYRGQNPGLGPETPIERSFDYAFDILAVNPSASQPQVARVFGQRRHSVISRQHNQRICESNLFVDVIE